MIQEVKMYTVICDNCGKDNNEDTDYSCWNDESIAEEIAMESNYLKDDDKHYCPDCYSYDDNDELILNPTATTV